MGIICCEECRQRPEGVILVQAKHIEIFYRTDQSFSINHNGGERTNMDVTTTANVQSMESAAVDNPTYPQAALPVQRR